MAVLSDTDRQRVWRALMRYWSQVFEAVSSLTKADLQAAVNATDGWINDNQGAYNNALPAAAKNNLTASQKTLLFCAVGLMRVNPDVGTFLKRIFGEVD